MIEFERTFEVRSIVKPNREDKKCQLVLNEVGSEWGDELHVSVHVDTARSWRVGDRIRVSFAREEDSR